MTNRRQKPIPVTASERDFLELQKQRFEDSSGTSGDWGEFLRTVALLGLAAAGIYALARAIDRTSQSANVECCHCKNIFALALSQGVGNAIQVTCPHCKQELVVSLS